MSELRWNPLLKTYTLIAANRQARPNMPKDFCPFCPKFGKVPENYDVHLYSNDFPALTVNPSPKDSTDQWQYTSKENYGVCEVVLYSPDHNTTLPQLSEAHIYKLIELWTERTKILSRDKNIKYVFVFENRGAEVGVTMPHPHGQIYGYPFVPLKLQTELNSCKEYYNEKKGNLMLDMNKEEIRFQQRVIYENDNFICFLPFFTDYPYGVFISAKKSRATFLDFPDKEKKDLANILKIITGGLDNLFNKLFPYMMCVHQAPFNSPEYRNSSSYFNFHIEFYPPLRNVDTIKYYASSEMGAWAAANTRLVEETALELRTAVNKFMLKENIKK